MLVSSCARWRHAVLLRGNLRTVPFRRAITQEQNSSCSTEICSTFGGKRVRPLSAKAKSNLWLFFMDPITPSATLGLAKRAWEPMKRLIEYGKRIATLEVRVEALEEKLAKQPPDACNKCGERAMRVTRSWPPEKSGKDKWRQDEWKCEKCGHQESRIVRF